MKKFKRIMALVIALAMVLGMTSMAAFADDPVNERTLDSEIKVSGLEEGDVISYYKVVEWEDSKGWKLSSKFAGLATSGKDGDYVMGATPAEKEIRDDYAKKVLEYITGLPAKVTEYNSDGTIKTKLDAIPGRVNSTLAGQIATVAQGTTEDGTGAPTDGEWTLAITDAEDEIVNEAGLYLVLIKAGKTGVVYNPIFVAADYAANPDTNSIPVGDSVFSNEWAADLDQSYSDQAIAKKTEINVDKTATDSDGATAVAAETDLPGKNDDKSVNEMSTGDVGEVVKFVVETTIPEYADNYTNIMFSVTDTLSTGLILDTTTAPKVETLNATSTAVEEDITSKVIPTGSGSDTASIYQSGKAPSDITAGGNSYEIAFTHAYLHSLERATKIRITYYAKITDAIGAENVSTANNTVTVKYSNNPNNSSDYGVLKDVTNHYTFSIDADIFGDKTYETSEIVKIGVDKDGNLLTETKTLNNGTTTSPLEGAKFALFTSQDEASAVAAGTTTLANATTIYKNYKADGTTVNFDGSNITSDGNGKLNIHGLDVGKYYLVETTAPSGYIADSTVHTIEISAKYEPKEVTETINGKEVKYNTQVLKSYTIKVDQTESTYTATYEQDATQTETGASLHLKNTSDSDDEDTDTNDPAADISHFITNTQGVALPSTGGIGTTIFYVVGAMLVIGAGVILITRRRMDA